MLRHAQQCWLPFQALLTRGCTEGLTVVGPAALSYRLWFVSCLCHSLLHRKPSYSASPPAAPECTWPAAKDVECHYARRRAVAERSCGLCSHCPRVRLRARASTGELAPTVGNCAFAPKCTVVHSAPFFCLRRLGCHPLPPVSRTNPRWFRKDCCVTSASACAFCARFTVLARAQVATPRTFPITS